MKDEEKTELVLFRLDVATQSVVCSVAVRHDWTISDTYVYLVRLGLISLGLWVD